MNITILRKDLIRVLWKLAKQNLKPNEAENKKEKRENIIKIKKIEKIKNKIIFFYLKRNKNGNKRQHKQFYYLHFYFEDYFFNFVYLYALLKECEACR